MNPEPLIRNVSDTALWAAMYRARETERPDALFSDPFAQRLAGARGAQIADSSKFARQSTWSWIARTYLFDQYITQQVKAGVDVVINLAAGLDARPYRMSLPSSLRWIEVDLPDLIAYKEEILAGEKPNCLLQRVRLDLTDLDARRRFFTETGRDAKNAMIITEGLLIYLSREEVAALARDLADIPSFHYWILELGSPGLLRLLQRKFDQLQQAGAPLKFAPPEGPAFFEPYGWKAAQVRSFLKTAAKLGRLPLLLRLMSLFPESNGRQGRSPWAGACLMARQ